MPNPAKDYIIFEYKLEMSGNSQIRILNIKGNLVHTIELNKIQGQEIYHIDNLLPGVYIATLSTTNKMLQSVKFTVVQ